MTEHKVISYSLWGSDPKYLIGAIENAKMAAKIYPGWVCRYYVDERIDRSALTDLGAETVIKPACDDYMGLYWRFEIAGDESVDRFCIRDTDSRLTKRDGWAVREWEQSGRPFHVMRDHRVFHNVPIMGGMWGATRGFMPDFMRAMEHWVAHECYPRGGRGFWGSDQVFLKRHVWPHIRNNMLCHDDWQRSTRCDPPATNPDRRFHVKLGKNLFVGQVYDECNCPVFPESMA